MAATPEVLFELDDSDATIGILIGQGNKGTSFTSFDRHFRHDRNAGTSGNHCQDGCELAALKHDVGLQLGAAAHGKSAVAKAVAILEQKKRIVLNLL